MYEHILVPLKADPETRRSSSMPPDLRISPEAWVILAHVVHSHSREEAAFLETEARSKLQALGEELSKKGVRTDIHVGHGEPGEGIVEAIEHVGADLVVMGTHGHGNVRHLLVGSVTDEILRNTDVPVLLIRP